ncbi:unnamed protein product [Didymodactylos carnosus]|uniref:RING-type domain-containing protein n=1 Tax=Didymodactylos carnosus TaxID=1234261 RepID=A0A814SZW2_9BILA|nr:unnamed protein product [Didymodactylos carnosus]CAF3918612.1 unnamed protein product [Didymodactylos carnosus]
MSWLKNVVQTIKDLTGTEIVTVRCHNIGTSLVLNLNNNNQENRVPCEFCNILYEFGEIEEHQNYCSVQQKSLEMPQDLLNVPINNATTNSGRLLESQVNDIYSSPSSDTVNKELENKIQILEERIQCQICMDREKNIVFVSCGHSCCVECAQLLHICHTCRKPITEKLKLV